MNIYKSSETVIGYGGCGKTKQTIIFIDTCATLDNKIIHFQPYQPYPMVNTSINDNVSSMY